MPPGLPGYHPRVTDPDPARRLDTVRRFRVPKRQDSSLAGALEPIRRALVRQQRAVGGMDTAWAELLPAHLAPLSSVSRLTPGGVLIIAVADAGASYEIDLWLRSGGLDSLRARCATTLRRVKLELAGPR